MLLVWESVRGRFLDEASFDGTATAPSIVEITVSWHSWVTGIIKKEKLTSFPVFRAIIVNIRARKPAHGQLTELRWKREERVQQAEGGVMCERNCWTRIYAAFPGSYQMLPFVGVQIGAINQFRLSLNQHTVVDRQTV
jgi:hypothetical protein